MSKKLKISNGKMYLGGEEFRLLSGALHYFRVVPEYWEDRLKKLKAMGLNTVETYIAWNVHEPREGEFCFEGGADVIRFIETAQNLGLYIIIRPGPFICAEWEMGGFPAWLCEVEGISLRHYNEPYLKKVDAYFDVLIPKLLPYLSTNGGNIIAMQVENEYGGFNSDDKPYLEYLKEGLIKRGVDVLLFTSDGTWDECLERGSLPDVFITANFGSRHEEAFSKVTKLRPGTPLVCMEFWNGWFDQWGRPHHTRDTESIINELSGMLDMGAGFNIYMFHGGTNFGFMNGSNCNPNFEPTITSYDYGAPLNECGDPTEQYFAIRKLISEKMGITPPPVPESAPKKAYGKIKLNCSASLFDIAPSLGKTVYDEKPHNMEYYGQYYGYILYSVETKGTKGVLDIGELRDRVMIFVDKKYVGVLERGAENTPIVVDGDVLDILIENMGRVNYGPNIYDKKGLLGDVKVNGTVLSGFKVNTLPMDNLDGLNLPEGICSSSPALYSGIFEIDEIADTFLKLPSFTKGIAVINGFNLGRYWNIGPQRTLYVPAPVLKKGKNKLIVFDLYGTEDPVAEFTDRHELG